jgi:hypothetical protein
LRFDIGWYCHAIKISKAGHLNNGSDHFQGDPDQSQKRLKRSMSVMVWYLRRMSPQELISYFENKELPETLRLDRASTQHEVKNAVERNIERMTANPDDWRAKHKLEKIRNAMETAYEGPGIPNL